MGRAGTQGGTTAAGRRSAAPPMVAALDAAALARLMPMHLILSPTGRVRAAGPTLSRVFTHGGLIGRSLFSLFMVRGPARISTAAELRARAGHRLHLTLRNTAQEVPALRMRGLAMPLAEDGGFLVNLTFGVDIVPAVGLLQLGDADFAATDMTMELLYLAEANAAVMSEMRALSQRLEDARLEAEQEALTDPLTGLRNRRACDSLLERLCREGRGFALLHIDLDHFKQVNDRLGHAAGDAVLVAVAAVLRAELRSGDFAARVGGDEFVLVLPGLGDAARLRAIGEAIVAAVARPVKHLGRECRVAASLGGVIVNAGPPGDPAQIMARADAALYEAKGAGRGRMVLATDQPPAQAAE